MSRIERPTDFKSTADATETAFNNHKVSAGKPVPKLTNIALKIFFKVFTDKTLPERVAIIQNSGGINADLISLFMKPYLAQRLEKIKTDADRLSLCQEIKSFCYATAEDQESLVFLDDHFQSIYKPLLEELVKKQSTTRQKLDVITFQKKMVQQTEDDFIREMLGTFYVCTIDKAEEFSSFLENQTSVKKIVIGRKQYGPDVNYKIGTEGVYDLTVVLKKNKTLKSLNLYNNQIDPVETRALAKALRKNKTLTSLNLKNLPSTSPSGGENKIGTMGARALAKTLKENHTLTSLIFKLNEIGREGARALAEALKGNSTLTNLNLTYSQIETEGASALADALKVNGTLTNLDLRGNKFGNEGTNALAGALKVNGTLTNLSLALCQIGNQGASALAEALKVNGTLTNLILAFCQIGNEGVRALAEVLKVNGTLTNLNLSSNGFGNEGASALAAALKVNRTLTNFNLAFCQIGDAGARELIEALRVNSTLTNLNLSNNLFNNEVIAALKQIMTLNPFLKIQY